MLFEFDRAQLKLGVLYFLLTLFLINGENMNKIMTLITIGIFMIVASGCSTWDKLDRTERGAIIGGGGGALVGGAAGGGGGALLGGAAGAVGGGVIGHELDKDKEEK